jgi:transposase
MPEYVELVLKAISELTVQVEEADSVLKQAAASDATCQLLMTAPGVGPTTAVRFVAAIDNVERFPNAHKVESYLGLTPGENSSSQRKRKTGLTKAGPSKLRWVLVQASWAARRFYKDDPMVLWSREVEKRRGKQVAVMALARRLAGMLYAMWRDKSTYDKDHCRSGTRAPSAAT